MSEFARTDRNVLLTGATGFIGGEILLKLEKFTTGTIWPLVRPGGEAVSARLANRYRRSGRALPPARNVRAVAGDVTQPDWGLAVRDRAAIWRQTDLIIHVAADTSFAPGGATDRTNVGGVRRLIELARRCRRNPLILYVSTATNGGKSGRCCMREEDGCRPENDHFNPYTQSKARAEALLHASGLPVVTVRPTIVLGARLPDAEFARQILWCVPIAFRFPMLPVNPEARMDLVDVHYVVDSILALLALKHRRHECYHISSGSARCVTLGHFHEVASRAYPRRKPPRLVRPEDWDTAAQRQMLRTRLQRRLYGSLRYYLPFMNMDVVYDDSRLREELGEATPQILPLSDYLPGLLHLIRAKAAVLEASAP